MLSRHGDRGVRQSLCLVAQHGLILSTVQHGTHIVAHTAVHTHIGADTGCPSCNPPCMQSPPPAPRWNDPAPPRYGEPEDPPAPSLSEGREPSPPHKRRWAQGLLLPYAEYPNLLPH